MRRGCNSALPAEGRKGSVRHRAGGRQRRTGCGTAARSRHQRGSESGTRGWEPGRQCPPPLRDPPAPEPRSSHPHPWGGRRRGPAPAHGEGCPAGERQVGMEEGEGEAEAAAAAAAGASRAPAEAATLRRIPARPLRVPGWCCGSQSRLDTSEPRRSALCNLRGSRGAVTRARLGRHHSPGAAQRRRPGQPCPPPRPSPSPARDRGEVSGKSQQSRSRVPSPAKGAGHRAPAHLAAAAPGGSR